jgi:hypothetical protein
VRGTYGGDRSDYSGDRSSGTAALQTIKLHLNHVVSSDLSYMTMDISDYYLDTPLDRPEYMLINRHDIPEDIQERYASAIHLVNDKAMVTKALYGIPQAGRLSQERLIPHLAQHGYTLCKNTPCLFRHVSRPVSFTLVVDDFGVAYKTREDAEHLATTLRKLYSITTDWSGTKYVGLSLEFDRAARTVTVSVPGYVSRALTRFGVTKLPHPTNTPLPFFPPTYGSGVQLAAPEDASAPLSLADATRLREIIGVFLFYAVSVDCTMLVALGRLASAQAKPSYPT